MAPRRPALSGTKRQLRRLCCPFPRAIRAPDPLENVIPRGNIRATDHPAKSYPQSRLPMPSPMPPPVPCSRFLAAEGNGRLRTGLPFPLARDSYPCRTYLRLLRLRFCFCLVRWPIPPSLCAILRGSTSRICILECFSNLGVGARQ